MSGLIGSAAGGASIGAAKGVGDEGGGGGGTVNSVAPGPGISISGTPTDPIVNNTGARSVTGTDNRVTASPTTGAVVIAQTAVADWAPNATRFFAVDGLNGSDANAGFSDVSAAAAGAAAKKTLTAISELIPPNGAGRVAQMYIANGGVNTSQTYTDVAQFLSQLDGYGGFGVCGTGTNANAGAVAFDGSSATDTYAGGVTVPGLNAAGYNPTGTPTATVVQMVKAGGGAPTLPAEPAAPLGWRIRFDINTTTAALRGACKTIAKVSGGDTVTLNNNLAAVPVAGDVFYVEKAGVILTGTGPGSFLPIEAPSTENFALIGIDVQTLLFIYSGRPVFAFCACNSLNVEAPAILVTNRVGQVFQANGSGANRNVGGGLRNAGAYGNLSFGGARSNWTGMTQVGLAELIVGGGANAIVDACCFGGGLVVQGSFGSTQQNDAADALGAVSAAVPVRYIASGANVGLQCGLQLRGVRLNLKANDFQGMGAHPAIYIVGACDVVVVGALTGSTGNTDVGMDLTQARGARIVLLSTPTVTGTAGDVRLAGGQVVTWAALAATGIIDSNGNQIVPVGQPAVTTVRAFSGLMVDTGGGGAEAWFASDVGIQQVSPTVLSADTAIGYPVSQRLITRLRACAPLGTSSALVFTVCKNGAPTAMTCTIPASSPAYTTASDIAHAVLFNDGDRLDVLVSTAGPLDGNTGFAGTVEGPC